MIRLPVNQVLVGDALERLRQLPSDSIDTVLTSPPYFQLRNYQASGQFGQEATIDEWVDHLRIVAREVARVLVPAGSFWLNVADRYAIHPREGATRKSLLLGPQRLALALHEDGWTIRNQIIWSKTNPMPTSVRDRLANTHETIWLLTRQRDYFFDLDAIRQPHVSAARPHPTAHDSMPAAWRGRSTDNIRGLVALKRQGQAGHPLGKNPGDVWRLSTSNFRGGHFATFPVRLAERAILAGCPEARCVRCRSPWRRTVRRIGATAVRGALTATCGCRAGHVPGLVLDPFLGAGTTGVAAEQAGRRWLGIELNPEFAALAEARLATARAGSGKQAA